MPFERVRDLLTGQELLEAVKDAAEKRHGIFKVSDPMTGEVVSGGHVLTMVDFGKKRGMGEVSYRLSEVYGENHVEGTLRLDLFTGEEIIIKEKKQ